MTCTWAESLGFCNCLEAMLKNLMPLPDTACSGPERSGMWQHAHTPSPASMLRHAVPRRVQPMQPCPGNICKQQHAGRIRPHALLLEPEGLRPRERQLHQTGQDLLSERISTCCLYSLTLLLLLLSMTTLRALSSHNKRGLAAT